MAPPPSSTKEPPALWEMVGSDVFEFGYTDPEGKPMKIKGCVCGTTVRPEPPRCP